MEQRFGRNRIDIEVLREFCEREGEMVTYRKGEQMEREGDPARWFGFVAEGCFKYVTHGISDDREHITWFSFEGEFAGDYPACLDGRPAQTTIEAMMSSRIYRVSGGQLLQWFRENGETMELRAVVAEHLLFQARRSHLDFHRTTARERYELLMRRCPGIVFASPMYFFQITAQLRAFIERLFFPLLSYKDYSCHPPKGRIPTAFIYTMNAPAEMLHVQENNMNENEMIIGNALEKPERILAVNTLQVKNYDHYDMQGFNLAAKQQWHEEHWQEELQNAFDAGKRMAEKIME